jgi:hypothetical protein
MECGEAISTLEITRHVVKLDCMEHMKPQKRRAEVTPPIADPRGQGGGSALWPLVVFALLLPLAFWAGYFKSRAFDTSTPQPVGSILRPFNDSITRE